MATTTKKITTKYDPVVGIRVPEAVRRGLKKLAEAKGDTLTGVILESLRPFELYASEEGQEALRRLEEVVARSTSIHKAPPSYHDAEGRKANPPAEEWHGLELLNYGTSAEPLWLHRVRQREGQTREEAVKSYALDLWKEWGFLTTEGEREAFVGDLESGSHVFLISYVDFKRWHVFSSSYEARLHRVSYGEGAEPSTPAEVRFYSWCVEWLGSLWEKASSQDPTAEVVVLQGGQGSEGAAFTQWLTHYPDATEEENLQRWARTLVRAAQRDSSGEDFETLCSRAAAEAYNVRRVLVHEES